MTSAIVLVSLIVLCLVDLVHVWNPPPGAQVHVNRLSQISSVDEYMNVCLDGRYHKKKSGPEKFLYNECSRYQKRSCCHGNTTTAMYLQNRWHGMNYNHCPGETMGDKCRHMFMKELCFYECSPNVGPWLVQVDQKLRRERPYGVPMCQSQCETWWQACKQEYTCVTNWGSSFVWKNGANHCPENSTCDTYQNKFSNASYFCEKLWDGSWQVVPDNHPCFRFDFDPTQGNPNDAVAMYQANYILTAASDNLSSVSVSILMSFSVMIYVNFGH